MADRVDAENSKFQLLDWGLLLGAAGIWGASFFFIDIGLEVFSPGLVTFFRIGFGCLTLWAIPIRAPRIEAEDRKMIMCLGFTSVSYTHLRAHETHS